MVKKGDSEVEKAEKQVPWAQDGRREQSRAERKPLPDEIKAQVKSKTSYPSL